MINWWLHFSWGISGRVLRKCPRQFPNCSPAFSQNFAFLSLCPPGITRRTGGLDNSKVMNEDQPPPQQKDRACLPLPGGGDARLRPRLLPAGVGRGGGPGRGERPCPPPARAPGEAGGCPRVGGVCSWKTAARVSDRLWGWGGRCVWEKPSDGSSLLLTTLSPSGRGLHWRRITARENH